MTKFIGKSILAVLIVFNAFAQGANASFDTQVGKQEYTYTFKVDGAAVTGTAKGNLITDSMLSDVKIDGNTITFVEKGTYMGMPLEFKYSGEIAGNEIKFKRELMGFPAEEFVAKRSP
jgi:archaellum component FlaF (FlaF/FlaG flagellin family)